MPEKKTMNGLWRDDPATPEGKFLVKRRDGTIPEYPFFILGARDPCVPAALRAYADEADKRGLSPGYAAAVRRLAGEFEEYRAEHGEGDPDKGPHRPDDPATIAEMRKARGA